MVRTFTTHDGVQHCYGCARALPTPSDDDAAATPPKKKREIWLPRVGFYLADMSSISIDSVCVSTDGMTPERIASLLHAFDAQVVPHMRDRLVQALVEEAAASAAAPLTQSEDAMRRMMMMRTTTTDAPRPSTPPPS